jgi:hypothetical protein
MRLRSRYYLEFVWGVPKTAMAWAASGSNRLEFESAILTQDPVWTRKGRLPGAQLRWHLDCGGSVRLQSSGWEADPHINVLPYALKFLTTLGVRPRDRVRLVVHQLDADEYPRLGRFGNHRAGVFDRLRGYDLSDFTESSQRTILALIRPACNPWIAPLRFRF